MLNYTPSFPSFLPYISIRRINRRIVIKIGIDKSSNETKLNRRYTKQVKKRRKEIAATSNVQCITIHGFILDHWSTFVRKIPLNLRSKPFKLHSHRWEAITRKSICDFDSCAHDRQKGISNKYLFFETTIPENDIFKDTSILELIDSSIARPNIVNSKI